MPANFLVVVVDGLRASALGAYGNTTFSTPALDQFAAESQLFDWCHATSPDLHEIYRAFWHPSPSTGRKAGTSPVPSLPQQFANHNYATTLITDDPQLKTFAASTDFHEIVQVANSLETIASSRRADDPFETGLARLFTAMAHAVESGNSNHKPHLIWTHSRGMYGAWDAPLAFQHSLLDDDDPPPVVSLTPPDFIVDQAEEPDAPFRFACAYAAQVMVLDTCWENLFDSIAAATGNQWLIMLIGARGFSLGEHGRIGGVDSRLYAEQLHVPWLIRMPGNVTRLARSQSLASHQDQTNSLLDWLNHGPSAAASIASVVPRDAIISTSSTARAIRTSAWCLREDFEPKYEAATAGDAISRPQLFVRPDDRWEANDVAKLCPEVVEELRAQFATDN